MSASQEKKRRQEQRAEGVDKRLESERKLQREKAKRRTITAVISIVIVLLAVAVILINSNFFLTKLPAVEIGGVSYTASEFNYFYFSSYFGFVESYGDYIQYFLDTSQPLDSQQYSEDMTWADYFEQSALDSMRQITMLYNEAVAAGYSLSEEDRGEIDTGIGNYELYASMYGYSNLNHYLQANYGRGFNEATMRKLMEISLVSSKYAEDVYDALTYTDEELEAYYQENRDKYDIVSYRSYFISGSEVIADEAEGIEGVDAETAMANAKAQAEAIAEAADEAAFAELVYDSAPEDDKSAYEDEDSTLNTMQGMGSEVYAEWLFDDARLNGDCQAFEDESGWYAVMYVSREDNHYNTQSVRHILKQAEADEDGIFTEEAIAAAKQAAEILFDTWRAGDATEDSFAELANLNSDDSGSNTNGGLYENIYKNQMVPEFNDFCFGEREYGDTEIVFGESGSYAGYHIMFYVGEGPLYSHYLAQTQMRSDDYQAWQEAKLEGWPVTTGFTFRFAR